jgi:hypothetical protein
MISLMRAFMISQIISLKFIFFTSMKMSFKTVITPTTSTTSSSTGRSAMDVEAENGEVLFGIRRPEKWSKWSRAIDKNYNPYAPRVYEDKVG